jgi:DNA-binding SARP family transcriptional activator
MRGSALPYASHRTTGRRAQDGPERQASLVVPAKVRVPPTDALPRERLQALLETIWRYRLGVVVAPAGSGKTTLLSGFAAASGVPVAWYRAETWDTDEHAALRHLEASLTAALPSLRGGWDTVEDAAAALETWTGGRALLVVDDAHTLEATPAEQALGRLVEYAPPWLAIMIGSRVPPGFNLSRLRVSGELLEIGRDELRFRAWEVERLFRDFYRDPVPPSDLAVLARRTEGWAAGLQLFHLATRGKSAEERRRILTGAGTSSRLVREYLTWNVMADLPDELRDFLVDTCVLGRLDGALCDRLLGRHGSGALLDELFRRQIFTVEIDDADASYRYHEVLRSHLDRMLVERIGEEAARERYGHAAALLEEAGASAEALGAYCRAEDWAAVRRLLGGAGERLAGGPSAWLESLPAAVVRHEPWLELAAARGARAEGRWADAVDGYSRAESGFGPSAIALACHRERLAVRAWLDPVAPAPADWTRVLRAGLVREPLVAAREAGRDPDVPAALCRGLLLLAGGEVAAARRELVEAGDDPRLDPVLGSAARLAAGVAAVLGGDPAGTVEIDGAAELADRAGASWLARLARAATRLDALERRADAAAGAASFAPDDPWGTALAALIGAWSPDPDPDAIAAAERRAEAAAAAATAFRRLGSGVLEAWARTLQGLGGAESGGPDAREAAVAAESFARATGVSGARLVAYRAMALADPARAGEFEQLADAVARETGLRRPPAAGESARPATEPAPVPVIGAPRRRDDVGPPAPSFAAAPSVLHGVLRIRTLGGFGIEVGGVSVALDGIKPRPRALLRLLASNGGQPVHREVIAEALWPEADGSAGGRGLHVAVSNLRGFLGEALGPEGARLIARDGDAYRLAVPPEVLDVACFERAAAEGRAARAAGETSIEAFERALDAYGGDLLPEDGPAEWVVERRERLRAEVVEVARGLAEAALLADDPATAIRACRTGLGHDRYHDPLWRLLIEARDRAGDVGAASRDRREYQGILAALGLPEPALSAS